MVPTPGAGLRAEGAAASEVGTLKLDRGQAQALMALDFPTVGVVRLALPRPENATMATVTHRFQSALDRLDRPLALLVVGLFLLALRRAER